MMLMTASAWMITCAEAAPMAAMRASQTYMNASSSESAPFMKSQKPGSSMLVALDVGDRRVLAERREHHPDADERR